MLIFWTGIIDENLFLEDRSGGFCLLGNSILISKDDISENSIEVPWILLSKYSLFREHNWLFPVIVRIIYNNGQTKGFLDRFCFENRLDNIADATSSYLLSHTEGESLDPYFKKFVPPMSNVFIVWFIPLCFASAQISSTLTLRFSRNQVLSYKPLQNIVSKGYPFVILQITDTGRILFVILSYLPQL